VEPVEDTLDHFRPPLPGGPPSPTPRQVMDVLRTEERRFDEALDRGRRVLSRQRFAGPLGEDDYRYLHDTHGLPRDLVDLLREPYGARPTR
jgi:alanyl-tRNA synthetase